jgi:hypothetical protein
MLLFAAGAFGRYRCDALHPEGREIASLFPGDIRPDRKIGSVGHALTGRRHSSR